MNELPLPWFRERDADELEREAEHVRRMEELERAAIAAGFVIRPKFKESNDAA